MMNRDLGTAAATARIVPVNSGNLRSPRNNASVIDEKKLLDTARRLTDLYLSGKSLADCAKEEFTRAGSVSYLLKCAGVQTRTRHEVCALRNAGVRAQVIADYRSGEMGMSAIAQKHGVSRSSVYEWVSKAGYELPHKAYNERDVRLERAVYDYIHTSKPLSEIEKEHHVYHAEIYPILEKRGMPRRGRGKGNGPRRTMHDNTERTLSGLHTQVGETMEEMRKMFADLSSRMKQMEKMFEIKK